MTSNVLAGGMDTQRLTATDTEQERRRRQDTAVALYLHRQGQADLLDVLGIAAPRRIQLRRVQGWTLPDRTIVVARPSRWGNPYAVGDPGIGDRAAAVDAFGEMLIRHMLRGRVAGHHGNLPDYPDLATIRRDLAGWNLACWCPLPAPGQLDICHARVLIAFANRDGDRR